MYADTVNTVVSVATQAQGSAILLVVLGMIITLVTGYVLRVPIIQAFVKKNAQYIRPVCQALLDIMNEQEAKPLSSGKVKEAHVLSEFSAALTDPGNKVITPKSTKWLDYLGGAQFVVKNILFPGIKLLRKA